MRRAILRFRLRTLLLVAPVLAALIGLCASRYLEYSADVSEQRARDTLCRKTNALGGEVWANLVGLDCLTVHLSQTDTTDSELRRFLPYAKTWFEKRRYADYLRISVVDTRVTAEGVDAFRQAFPDGVVVGLNEDTVVRKPIPRPSVALLVDQHLVQGDQ